MARFTGTGTMELGGRYSRMYDCRVETVGGVVMSGSDQKLENCEFVFSQVRVSDNSRRVIIRGNYIIPNDQPGILFLGRNDGAVVVGNVIADGVGGG